MVIDNCLPQSIFDDLVKQVTDWDYTNWFFVKNTAYKLEDRDLLFHSSLAHSSVLAGEDNSVLSSISRKAVNIILFQAGENLESIYRIRFGLITCTSETIIHDPHVDYEFKHRTGLLYLNDSDGDTIFYDKFHKPGQPAIKCGEEDIVQRVEPKSNRVTLFDGWQYHSSSTPTKNTYRLVMNFNYTVT